MKRTTPDMRRLLLLGFGSAIVFGFIASASLAGLYPAGTPPEELLALDKALGQLTRLDPTAGQLVKLRYFAGLSVEQAAATLNLSTATAYRHWTFARAWLDSQVADRSADSAG